MNRLQSVVILTAHVSVDTHQDLVFAGATDFLGKPFHVEQLRHTCESALRHAELMESSAELQLAEGTIFEVGNRVLAADFWLSVGKVQAAAHYLKGAVTFYRYKSPMDG